MIQQANPSTVTLKEPQFTFEEVTDPGALAGSQERLAAFSRNSDWLQAHWSELLPRVRGRFIAVAGQEPFVAETAAEAWEWAASTHPEDVGPVVRYVPKTEGPRIYANRWSLAQM